MDVAKLILVGVWADLSLEIWVWSVARNLRGYRYSILLLTVFAVGYFSYLVAEEIEDITYEPELQVRFRDSPLLSATRKRRDVRVLDAYYKYLKGLGLNLPNDTPPIGTGGIGLSGGVVGSPSIYSQIIVPEGAVDVPAFLRFQYSQYNLSRLLGPPPEGKPSEFHSLPVMIMSCYYVESFVPSQPACGIETFSNFPDNMHWLDAFRDIRHTFGQQYTDGLLSYTIQKWQAVPSKSATANAYFLDQIVSGEIVINNSQDRFNAVRDIFKKHGI